MHAVIGIYEQLGMFYEDVVSTVAAWGAVKRNPDTLIGDLLQRITISGQANKAEMPSSLYHDLVFNKLARSNERVRIHPIQLLESLHSLGGEEFLREIGIAWKTHPSVKYVSKGRQREWSKLPIFVMSFFESFRDPKSLLLSISYNKLKHGPQFIVSSAELCAQRRGHAPDSEQIAFLKRTVVRVLHKGARTQEETHEIERGERAAPFLLGDVATLRHWVLGSMFFPALGMFTLADWLLRRQSGSHLKVPDDPVWEAMFADQQARVGGAGLPF